MIQSIIIVTIVIKTHFHFKQINNVRNVDQLQDYKNVWEAIRLMLKKHIGEKTCQIIMLFFVKVILSFVLLIILIILLKTLIIYVWKVMLELCVNLVIFMEFIGAEDIRELLLLIVRCVQILIKVCIFYFWLLFFNKS